MEKKYRVNSNYIIRKVAEEYLLIAIDDAISSDNKLMILNGTGYFIWENLKNYKSLDELIHIAEKNFTGKNAVIREEIKEFVISMVRLGLIEEGR